MPRKEADKPCRCEDHGDLQHKELGAVREQPYNKACHGEEDHGHEKAAESRAEERGKTSEDIHRVLLFTSICIRSATGNDFAAVVNCFQNF